MTDPKLEELVLKVIASNPQTRFDFVSDFHVKYLGVRFPNSGFVSNSTFEISFQD